MTQEYNEVEDDTPTGPEPRLYQIFLNDGKRVDLSGFLGLHENFLVLASNEGRFTWGCPVTNVHHFESPETGQVLPFTKQ